MTNDALIRSLVADLTPVRRLPRVASRALAWIALAVACVCTGTYLLGTHLDFGARLRMPSVWIENGLLLAVFGISTRAAFALSVPGLAPRSWERVLPLLGLGAWLSVIVWHGSNVDSAAFQVLHPWFTFSCVRQTGLLALVPTLSLFAMLRSGAAVEPRWATLLACVSSIAIALMGTQVLCVRFDVVHALLWHAGPMLVAGAVGVLFGRGLWRRSWRRSC